MSYVPHLQNVNGLNVIPLICLFLKDLRNSLKMFIFALDFKINNKAFGFSTHGYRYKFERQQGWTFGIFQKSCQ